MGAWLDFRLMVKNGAGLSGTVNEWINRHIPAPPRSPTPIRHPIDPFAKP